MLKVYIVGGGSGGYSRMFIAAGWALARNIKEADLVQFTGGEDVSPCLYGEERHPYTGDSIERDLYEAGYFAFAQRMGIPMAGICRGGQFLNVMSGGSMYQHVSKHATGQNHSIYDQVKEKWVNDCSSTHHQMMRHGDLGQLIGTANEGGFKEYVKDGKVVRIEDDIFDDVEVVYYAHTKALCFQPHAEFFGPGQECFEYYFELIERVHGLRA